MDFPSSVVPTPPTDSLHKFLAISSLLITLSIFGFLLLLNNQNFDQEEWNKANSWLISKEATLRMHEARLASLKRGRINENKVPGISDNADIKDEPTLLGNSISLLQRDIQVLKEQTATKPQSWLSRLAYSHFREIIIVAIGFSTLFLLVGFKKWATNQRLADELQQLELEIKRRQLDELNANKARQKVSDEIQVAELKLKLVQLKEAQRPKFGRRYIR